MAVEQGNVASRRIKSDDDVVRFAFGRARVVGRQRGVVSIERRAIGAHILYRVAHVAIDMRMVMWWQRAHTHEFLGADLDDRNAGIVMEMRNDLVCHAGIRSRADCRCCRELRRSAMLHRPRGPTYSRTGTAVSRPATR
jgi:hypothetical protein